MALEHPVQREAPAAQADHLVAHLQQQQQHMLVTNNELLGEQGTGPEIYISDTLNWSVINQCSAKKWMAVQYGSAVLRHISRPATVARQNQGINLLITHFKASIGLGFIMVN